MRSEWARSASLLEIPYRRNQRVNFFASIIKCQRRTNCTFHAKTSQDRLSAMVSSAHCYALLIQSGTDLIGSKTIHYKGKHAGFVRCRTNQAQSRNAFQSFGCVDHEFVFIARNIVHANALEIVDRSTKTHSISDAARAGLKPQWCGLINRLLECDVLNHVAAALPGTH